MPNKDNLIIQPSGEIISDAALPSDVIVFNEEKRQKVIQILRQLPAFLDSAKQLSEGKTYQAYIAPEVLERIKDGSARLANRDNGLFGANILDAETGKIIHNASLMEVTPELLGSLNQLTIQQALANIVHRLEVVDEKITVVLQGQFHDRLSDIKTGIHLYEQALAAKDIDSRRKLMGDAILKLNSGRDKLITSTDFSFIDKLPRNRLGMLFSRNRNFPEHVQAKAEIVVKATYAINEATRYLVLAYSDLNEPDSLRVSLKQAENEFKVFQDKTGEIVRWLLPESNLHESLTSVSQGVLPSAKELDEISQKSIVIEFQPKEISPPEGL